MTQTGQIAEVEPDLCRVLAPNPSPFTAGGTNTWVLGGEEPCVIDPGPAIPAHLDAILTALAGRRPRAIVVTHAHLDHSALAPALAGRTGAPVLAFGDAQAGWRPMAGRLGRGFGVDWEFRPDIRLRDGEALEGPGWRLVAMHTPGHMGNHLCLDDGARLFSGDHAMGFATSVVSPPEGDMGDYLDSLDRLIGLGERRLLPGHGGIVADGAARLHELRALRRLREAEVLDALATGPASATEVADRLYREIAGGLRGAARRNVLAHLIHLERQGLARAEGPPDEDTAFRRV